MEPFQIAHGKAPHDEYPVSIDFSQWLAGETITAVDYSAIRVASGADATADVLDAVKHANTTTVAKPWIKGGVAGAQYEVRVRVTTSTGAKKEARVRFMVG